MCPGGAVWCNWRWASPPKETPLISSHCLFPGPPCSAPRTTSWPFPQWNDTYGFVTRFSHSHGVSEAHPRCGTQQHFPLTAMVRKSTYQPRVAMGGARMEMGASPPGHSPLHYGGVRNGSLLSSGQAGLRVAAPPPTASAAAFYL